jgi:hypothetical protein
MKTAIFPFLLSALLLPIAAGCGSLPEAPGDAAALATMNGTLSVASGAQAPASVRVALVWRTDLGEGDQRGFNVAEDLEVAPQFPARFQLTVRNAPPASALFLAEKDFDMKIAVGSVVAYEDKNQNGKLDLVPAKSTSFVDGIVGANDELIVVWLPKEPTAALARELRDPQGGLPRAGYNLYKRQTPLCTVTGGNNPGAETVPGAPATPCTGTTDIRWLPIDAPFDLPIVTDPKFNSLMCQSTDPGPGPDGPPEVGPTPAPADPNPGGPSGPSVPQGPFPAAGSRGLVCSPDGRRFTYSDCREPRLCEAESSCAAEVETLPPGAAAPAGWPCTVR